MQVPYNMETVVDSYINYWYLKKINFLEHQSTIQYNKKYCPKNIITGKGWLEHKLIECGTYELDIDKFKSIVSEYGLPIDYFYLKGIKFRNLMELEEYFINKNKTPEIEIKVEEIKETIIKDEITYSKKRKKKKKKDRSYLFFILGIGLALIPLWYINKKKKV